MNPCLLLVLRPLRGMFIFGLTIAAMPVAGQISPGALSRAHQPLEGTTKCATCHNFGTGTRGFKCLECHTEIARRVESRIGYHQWAYNPSPTQVDCARCHLEHNGRQFAITRWDKKTFNHKNLAGFELAGKHKELQCETCHTSAKISADARAEIKVKDLNKSFLGLDKNCSSCHSDPHSGQLGIECVKCHSQDSWKPASGFSHFRTEYPLTGAHQSVACEKCHGPRPGEVAVKYKGLAHGGCQDCHGDPHKGAFQDAKVQGGCTACHSTSGWNNNQTASTFEHKNTKFPLRGKHAELTCAQCHKDSNFARPIAHELCGDCHQDVHKNQFASRAAGSDCASCHNEEHFKPALFTRETHQKSAFRLEGRHAALECTKCHQPESKDAVYMTGKLLCGDCHGDPHGGEFAGAPYANKCETCHTQERFTPSTFSPGRHAQTRFALTGAHAAVLCQECHKPLQSAIRVIAAPAVRNAARQYHIASATCTSCHTDPHQAALTCETCHNVNQWTQLRPFNHAATKFALEGAHQTVNCAGCHRPTQAAANTKVISQFSHTPSRCSECHQDVHGGQFTSPGSEQDCSSCHTITRWGAGSFDHGKTHFPLDGSHGKVRCAQCHTQQVERDGTLVRIYRGTPTTCADCHTSDSK